MQDTVEVTVFPVCRYHVVYPDDLNIGTFLVRVYEYEGHGLSVHHTWEGGKVLNEKCPANSMDQAKTMAKVFWMERLGNDYDRTLIAREHIPSMV